MPLDAANDDPPEMIPFRVEMQQTITVRWAEPGYIKATIYSLIVGFGVTGGVFAWLGVAAHYSALRALVLKWVFS
jgi:hypothetical protein